MKELSVEKKAKAYDEKLDVARHIYADPSVKDEDKYYIEVIFPELTESEDERIRENIIATIHLYYGEPLEDEAKEMIAWLEKLCEHKKFRDAIQVGDKVTRNEDGVLVNLSQLNRVAKTADKQGEQKPAANIEPKFKVGQTIIYKGTENIAPTKMTISDIAKGQYWDDNCCIVPISDQDNWELVEQKPAWSKEDEKLVKNLISTLSNLYARNLIEKETKEKYTNLLKSLKDRVLPQPKQEWSDFDKDILFRTIDSLKFLKDTISKDPKYAVNIIDIEREISWLKSLRPQSQWKPSESDILLLERITNGMYNPKDFQVSLCGLIGQLKKLRED